MLKQAQTQTPTPTLYPFQVKTIDHEDLSLSHYKGKVLLIVNVASRCGFTPQYTELETLYETYKNKGFFVLGFPCNQFGNQEPGSEAEIKKFCELTYRVSFPLFAKINVNGSNADPLFQFLTKSLPGLLGIAQVKWNFTKFLVNKEGVPVKRYAPQTKPHEIAQEIEKLLAHKLPPLRG